MDMRLAEQLPRPSLGRQTISVEMQMRSNSQSLREANSPQAYAPSPHPEATSITSISYQKSRDSVSSQNQNRRSFSNRAPPAPPSQLRRHGEQLFSEMVTVDRADFQLVHERAFQPEIVEEVLVESQVIVERTTHTAGAAQTRAAEMALLQPRIIETRTGEPTLVDVRELDSTVTSTKVFLGESRVVSQRDSYHRRVEAQREVRVESPQIERVTRQKVVEVICENPVAVEQFVDVTYDVHVDVPIERIIERERIYETVVERNIEKTVEVPVEQLIEVPVERVVEVPYEQRRVVEVPYETIVERPFDVTRENLIVRETFLDIDEQDLGAYAGAEVLPTQVSYHHQDRIVETPIVFETLIQRHVPVAVPRTVEVVREVKREVRVPVVIERPVPVERVVVQEVDTPVENIIYKNIDIIVERPVYLENLIDLPVPIEVVVEREIIVPVEHLIERPVYVEQLVEKRVDFPVEVAVAYEELVDVPVEKYYETALEVERAAPRVVEKLVRKSVPRVQRLETPFETFIERLVPLPVEHVLERRVNRYVERPVERIVERPVYIERVVEQLREVERVVEVPLAHVREVVHTVEKVVERPVYFDMVIEKQVEVIVEQVVEVPVEKVVEVPVNVYLDRPVINEVLREEEVEVQVALVEVREEPGEAVEEEEFFDAEMEAEIALRRQELDAARLEQEQLNASLALLRGEVAELMQIFTHRGEEEYAELMVRYTDVASRFNAASEYRVVLEAIIKRRRRVVESQVNVDPRAESLRARLANLLAENGMLIEQLSTKTSGVLASLPQEAAGRGQA